MNIRKANKDEILEIRKIAKAHGIKHVRTNRNKLAPVYIGRQTMTENSPKFKTLIPALEEAGYFIDMKDVTMSLIENNYADTLLVYKVV